MIERLAKKEVQEKLLPRELGGVPRFSCPPTYGGYRGFGYCFPLARGISEGYKT
jgi:hypothetical protein